MSEGFADFVKRKHRKTCEVVLERLDEEALKNCLQKYGLKLSSQNGSTKLPIHHKSPSKTDKSTKRKWRKRKNFELFVQKSKKFKRKKIKPLCYTDDENSSEDNKSFVTNGEVEADDCVEPEVFSNLEDNNISRFKSGITTNLTSESEKVSTAEKVSLPNKNEAERKSPPSEAQGKNESTLKHYLKNSFHSERSNSQDPGEIEIIQVLTKRSSVCIKTNPDEKSTEMSPVELSAAKSDEPVQHQDVGEDDYDSRDDSEDDKNTIIFEEEFQKDSDLDEFFELEEKEVKNKKFNNREITNRKRQRLVKFKRKSMAGRTSATFIRPKIKVAETCKEQEACEKPIECVSEECLGEVCSLVERLHELYRIILQLKKELPKNAELAVHFTRVINAQQENFHKEIRKSQKTIIKCYEKMLSVYSDTGQVAQVIGKRTSLNVEDVVNVISRCILIEGQCETDETAVGKQEKILDRKNKKSSENLTRPAKTQISQSESLPKQQTNENCVGFPPYTPTNLLHINHRPKLFHHPSGEFHTSLEPPAKEKPPAASDFPAKDSLQCYNDNQITRKNKPQDREQQNPLPSHHFKEPTLEQSLQSGVNLFSVGTVARHSLMHKPIGSAPGSLNWRYGACIPAKSVSPPHASRDGLNYATALFQRGSPPPESSAPGNESISNTVFPVSIRLPAVQNNTEYNRCLNKPSQNTQNFHRPNKATDSWRSRASLSVKYFNGQVTNSLKEIAQPSGAHCPLDTVVSDSVRLSDRRRLFAKIAELSERNSNVNSESVSSAIQDVQEVLDPTIPQKLTMRNCRLQAGPVLGLQDKGGQKLNPLNLLTEKQKISTEPGSLDRKDSNSRVYVCAQNDCKSLGVRVCKGCRSVIYCSETCQLKHWTLKHKSECYQLKALRG